MNKRKIHYKLAFIVAISLLVSTVYPVFAFDTSCPRGGIHYCETRETGIFHVKHLGTHQHPISSSENGLEFKTCNIFETYVTTKTVCVKCGEVSGYGERKISEWCEN